MSQAGRQTDAGAQTRPRSADDAYWKALVDCGYHGQDTPFIAHLGRLSRLNMTYLSNELIEVKVDIREHGTTNEKQMVHLGSLLHQYTDAVRDYQYISQLPQLPDTFALQQRRELERTFSPHLGGLAGDEATRKAQNAPYDTSYLSLNPKPSQRRDAIREFLRNHLPRHLSWTDQEKLARRADYSQGLPPEMYSPVLDRFARFFVGIFGGAWLVVPLLIMAFDSSLAKTMITVSVAVVLFALAISLFF